MTSVAGAAEAEPTGFLRIYAAEAKQASKAETRRRPAGATTDCEPQLNRPGRLRFGVAAGRAFERRVR